MSISIPSGAAERIILNPHILPRIPHQLKCPIHENQQRERKKSHSEQALFLRRQRLEEKRMQYYNLNFEEDSTTVITSPTASDDEMPESPLLFKRRSLSSPQIKRRRSLFDFHEYTSPIKKVYYTPEEDFRSTALKLLKNKSTEIKAPFYTTPAFINTKSPFQKAQLRTKYFKKPSPSSRSKQRSLSIQPSWHRMIRGEYRQDGEEQQWREERNRYLQDYRRNRQFTKQMARRLSY